MLIALLWGTIYLCKIWEIVPLYCISYRFYEGGLPSIKSIFMRRLPWDPYNSCRAGMHSPPSPLKLIETGEIGHSSWKQKHIERDRGGASTYARMYHLYPPWMCVTIAGCSTPRVLWVGPTSNLRSSTMMIPKPTVKSSRPSRLHIYNSQRRLAPPPRMGLNSIALS